MDVGQFVQGRVTVVEPVARIDTTTSRALGERLVAIITGGASHLLVDLSNVAYVSSTGFRALLIAAKKAEEQNCAFALCGLNAEVRRLFEIGAFIELFNIYPSRNEGIEALS